MIAQGRRRPILHSARLADSMAATYTSGQPRPMGTQNGLCRSVNTLEVVVNNKGT